MPFPGSVEPGKFARFSVDGRAGDRAGWVKYFPDGSGALFGSWRDGSSFCWQRREDGQPAPSRAEIEALRARAEAQRIEAEQERNALHAKTAKALQAMFEKLPPANADNPYLARKGVLPIGDIRQAGSGTLVIPVHDAEGRLQSVQYINPDGSKRFAADARMAGGRLILGSVAQGKPIAVVEGFATGCSVLESGAVSAVVCAFSGHNLRGVVVSLRERYDNQIIVCADLDTNGAGLRYAQAAIEGVPRAALVMPAFADQRDTGDFNDLFLAEGVDAVRSRLEAVLSDFDSVASPTLGQPFKAPDLPACDARDGTLTTRPLTELGNAQRLADIFGESIRYVSEERAWLAWNGGWSRDDGAKVRVAACDLPAKIYAEGAGYLSQAHFFAKHARASACARSIDSAVGLFSDMVRISSSSLDSDPMLVGFDHGRQVVDLRTGQTRPAKQDDFITKSLGVDRVGEARNAKRWLVFLDQVFEDAELVDWLQRFLGCMLTGSTDEQIFLFFYGHGSNGKSVLVELLTDLMADYSTTIQTESLMATKRQAGSATPDLVEVIGARLLTAVEAPEGGDLNENLIKALVGSDTLSVRPLYRAPIKFRPVGKLILTGNHKPIIHGQDYGIWRRVRLVPFNRTFRGSEKDPDLPRKLRDEMPHILAWIIEGCLRWQRQGLSDTPKVIAAETAIYQRDQDIVGRWIDECLALGDDFEAVAPELYANYSDWLGENGLRPCSNITFGRRLSERGFKVRRSTGGSRVWQGVRIVNGRHGGPF
ncbi:phage/plasmid primase, P4 family [Nitrosomonas halophila]|uniref:phage/plasmid primase, P4 family n=1 Tax=Nitrosomonas halophila TaxID=44576 RepID=UPI0015A1D70B|nr:phage/plasmid primase, P4 family [Nitrosomonas halophila]